MEWKRNGSMKGYSIQWHNEIIGILCTRCVCTLKQKMTRHFLNDFRTPPLSRNRQRHYSNPKFILPLKAKKITQWETTLLTVLHFTESVLLVSLHSSFSTRSHATLMSLVEKERLNWIEVNKREWRHKLNFKVYLYRLCRHPGIHQGSDRCKTLQCYYTTHQHGNRLCQD